MFESLSDKLQNITRRLKGTARITEKDLKEKGILPQDFKAALGNEIYLVEDRNNIERYWHYILIAKNNDGVMQLNAEDGGNRKFIMVQLPEVTDEKSEARKAGYENICDWMLWLYW